MPNETPFGPLESLVGRTFEKDRQARKVDWIAGVKRKTVQYRHSGAGLVYSAGATRFIAWLRGAKEVTP